MSRPAIYKECPCCHKKVLSQWWENITVEHREKLKEMKCSICGVIPDGIFLWMEKGKQELFLRCLCANNDKQAEYDSNGWCNLIKIEGEKLSFLEKLRKVWEII